VVGRKPDGTRSKGTKSGHVDNNATIAQNREAFHNYTVEDQLEAGISLTGSEIKSLRLGRASLREGFVRVVKGEAWLEGVHIPPYEYGTYLNHEPTRPRKLLLHKGQILDLGRRTQAQGYTIVPLRIYLKDGRAKVAVGIAKGKRQFDKRQSIAERDSKREIARELRSRG
jgi:SsrA-binding protein